MEQEQQQQRNGSNSTPVARTTTTTTSGSWVVVVSIFYDGHATGQNTNRGFDPPCLIGCWDRDSFGSTLYSIQLTLFLRQFTDSRVTKIQENIYGALTIYDESSQQQRNINRKWKKIKINKSVLKIWAPSRNTKRNRAQTDTGSKQTTTPKLYWILFRKKKTEMKTEKKHEIFFSHSRRQLYYFGFSRIKCVCVCVRARVCVCRRASSELCVSISPESIVRDR